jgi:hypothetical protein
MCCWQAGDLEATRAYVYEARPLHAGGRRIARVVLLSAACGLCLAEGDVAAAIDHGRDADREATELGVEREVPLIRSVLARALLAAGDVRAAAERTIAAVTAAQGLSFDFPFAVCLETAALVVLAGDAQADVADILGVAADLRERGHRPASPTLSPAVDEARARVGATGHAGQRGQGGHGPLDRARIDRIAASAIDLLSSLA